jgi:hypothetical protein
MPAQTPRILDTANVFRDPADAWELGGDEAELLDYGRRRMAAFPRRPHDWDDLPEAATVALRAALGPFELDDALLVPRTPRPTGTSRLAWVVTPTAVLAAGAEAVGYWVDSPDGGAVVGRLPFGDIAALVDRTVLLYGRLEIVGVSRSIVLRYNTVSRQFVRDLVLEVRRSFWPGVETADAGPGPHDVPLKWTNVLLSADMLPHGPQPRVVVARVVDSRQPPRHQGLAVLTPNELQLAIEPAGNLELGIYGVDLVVVPRTRILGLISAPLGLRVRVAVPDGEVELRVPAHADLASAAAAVLGPLVDG